MEQARKRQFDVLDFGVDPHRQTLAVLGCEWRDRQTRDTVYVTRQIETQATTDPNSDTSSSRSSTLSTALLVERQVIILACREAKKPTGGGGRAYDPCIVSCDSCF